MTDEILSFRKMRLKLFADRKKTKGFKDALKYYYSGWGSYLPKKR